MARPRADEVEAIARGDDRAAVGEATRVALEPLAATDRVAGGQLHRALHRLVALGAAVPGGADRTTAVAAGQVGGLPRRLQLAVAVGVAEQLAQLQRAVLQVDPEDRGGRAVRDEGGTGGQIED